MGTQNRRKIANTIVDKSGQLRLAIPFIFMLSLHLGSHVYLVRQVSRDIGQTSIGDAELSFLMQTVSRLSWIGMVSSTIFAFSCFLFWAVYSHRIFGPMVPFRRKIQSLIESKPEAPIRLRNKDEFKYLAIELNELAKKLEHSDAK